MLWKMLQPLWKMPWGFNEKLKTEYEYIIYQFYFCVYIKKKKKKLKSESQSDNYPDINKERHLRGDLVFNKELSSQYALITQEVPWPLIPFLSLLLALVNLKLIARDLHDSVHIN